ncbi:MAG: MurR/RpiR family transcriptional regulator [Candidatus Devosia phytovorans]|uniref:MurR/RpiR family transcriptional regulator n=1 Tax=Candidatus Devosia phytovorans TaxID=3121372 RepID=A0AAJ6AZW1_9HYPH|nr:MurR/RpiR family transcriptional regulator [Devosia sp.]WEK02888.1 MAG: MurR/RpiR family transcriptional regulator [Devosia sp.]
MVHSDLTARLEERRSELPTVLLRVAEYLDQNRFDVLSRSALALGEATGTSDATVIRAAKALGYEGLAALRRELAEEMAARSPARDLGASITAAQTDMALAIRQSIEAGRSHLEHMLGADVLEGIRLLAENLHQAERIVFFAIGPTRHLVRYAEAQLRRRGRKVHRLSHTGSMLADDLAGLAEGDAILALSYGQPYHEIDVTLSEAARRNIPVFLLTDRAQSPISARVRHTVTVPRRADQGVALHIGTIALLDSLVTALSLLDKDQAVEHLKNVERLRRALAQHTDRSND